MLLLYVRFLSSTASHAATYNALLWARSEAQRNGGPSRVAATTATCYKVALLINTQIENKIPMIALTHIPLLIGFVYTTNSGICQAE